MNLVGRQPTGGTAAAPERFARPHLRLVTSRPLRVVDVALFYELADLEDVVR